MKGVPQGRYTREFRQEAVKLQVDPIIRTAVRLK